MQGLGAVSGAIGIGVRRADCDHGIGELRLSDEGHRQQDRDARAGQGEPGAEVVGLTRFYMRWAAPEVPVPGSQLECGRSFYHAAQGRSGGRVRAETRGTGGLAALA